MDDDDLQRALAENYIRTWREQFHLQKNEPSIWADKAFQLFHASDVLYATYRAARSRHDADPVNYYKPVFSMVPVYELRLITLVYYLRGLALENLLKGTLVAKKLEPGKTHDLRKLATRIGVVLTDRQFLLLYEITQIVKWLGRYHVPHSADQMTPRSGLRQFPSIPGDLDEREEGEILALIGLLIEDHKKHAKIFDAARPRLPTAPEDGSSAGTL